jgi:tetratricopeptide (TPR) repeat protein
MKTAHIIRDMQQASRTAERLVQEGHFQNAVELYTKALQICAALPADCEFDRRRFAASIYAGLSAAQGKLGKHMECFAAANKALAFYDECGDRYPADVGRWLMALANQGTSLATLGCPDAAVEALTRAKDIFVRHGLDTEQNKAWLGMVDGNIAAIRREAEKLVKQKQEQQNQAELPK